MTATATGPEIGGSSGDRGEEIQRRRVSDNELQLGARGGAMSMRDLRSTLARNRALLLLPVLICVGLAGLATILVRPTYEGEATLRIQESVPGASLVEDEVPMGGLGLLGLGENEIDTDVSILQSRRLVDSVVDSLALHVQLLTPDTLRSEVLQVIDASTESVAGTYELRRLSDGAYELYSAKVRQRNGRYTNSMPEVRRLVQPPARIQVGEPFMLGNMTLALAPQIAARQPERIEFRVRPFNQYVDRVREKDLRVRQVERSQLVRIEYRYPDPELAAAAVNALSAVFIDYKLSTSTSDSNSKVRVLKDQVAAYERQIDESEAKLRAFQEQQLVVLPEEQATAEIERIAQVQVKRDAAVVERQALASVLEQAREDRSPDAPSPYRRLATYPAFLGNPAIQNLLGNLIQVENQRAALLVTRQPENRDVQALTERITDLELQLYQVGQNYLLGLDQQVEAASDALSGFSGDLRAIPAREIEFARLSRERTLLTEVYLLLQQHLKEAEVLAAIENETGTVRVVDDGLVPERPVFPNTPVYLALGAVLGLMVGVMAVVGRESMSTRIRTAADAEIALDGVPVLGVVPRHALGLAGNGHPALNGGPVTLRRLARPLPPRWLPTFSSATHPLPGSDVDPYRSLHANIAFSAAGEPPRVIVITSATLDEGKSTGALNLAITLARLGRRTILVDGVLGKPSNTLGIGNPEGAGFADVLAGRISIEEASQLVELEAGGTLFFLPSGGSLPPSTDLLHSEVLYQSLVDLKERYDSVVINAPPMDRSVDAAIFGRVADGTLIFVRSGETEQEALREAVARLRRLQAPIAGVVLSEG